MSQPLALVIGLGNPGGTYAHTRHNVGYDAIDRLAERLGARFGGRRGPVQVARVAARGQEWILAKPTTFMNDSGRAGRALTDGHAVPPDRLAVIHDDLDLPFGRLRIRPRGGAGGHNGVRSLQAAWRSQEFVRVRVGIGRPPADQDPVDYVLRRPGGWQRRAWVALCDRAAEAALAVMELGVVAAMDHFNALRDLDPGPDGEGE